MAFVQRHKGILPLALLLPGLAWLVIFFALPLYYQGKISLETGSIFNGYHFGWHFRTYTDAWSNYGTQFLRSFWYAGLSTGLSLLIGYPLAYAIAFRGGRWRNALAWETILDDSSPLVSFLQTLHIIGPNGRVLATTGSVVAGITYNFLPFMVLPLYASLERIDPRMLEAGADLYGNRRSVFRKITLPLSMPGVVAGVLLTFIPAAGDFVNATLLGSPKQTMIGNVIQSRYLEVTDYPTAAALSFTLMAIILLLVAAWAWLAGTESLMGTEAR